MVPLEALGNVHALSPPVSVAVGIHVLWLSKLEVIFKASILKSLQAKVLVLFLLL